MMSLLRWLGGLINALGVPGLVRDGEYRSTAPPSHVRVRCERLFTVVSVDGLDVYFRRFSGRIDGVGVNRDRSAPTHE